MSIPEPVRRLLAKYPSIMLVCLGFFHNTAVGCVQFEENYSGVSGYQK
jgi:hypothetical protein